MFEKAGYEFIGLDHFARRDEMLSRAARAGTLQRNFQGMTTGGGLDLLGVGASSISHLRQVGFLQNIHSPEVYAEAIHEGRSPIHRTRPFTLDDCVRQMVISQIYCGTGVAPEPVEKAFGIEFDTYFARELEVLGELEADGLVTIAGGNRVELTFPLGRVLMRNVAAVFDAYLEPDAYRVGESSYFSANA
jgi:oxygen-independent coproporphyrinogen-3 oxidase